jgi:O-antigen/teichoic acid export membrane protein
VEKEDRIISELFGSTILLALGLGLVLSGVMGLSSFFMDDLLRIKTGFLLRLFWPLTFVLLVQNMLQIVLRGMGRIRLLSVYFFIGRLFYLLMLGLLWYFNRFNLNNVSLSYLSSIGLAVLLFSFLPGPSFRHLRKHIQTLWREVAEYGRHLYTANLLTAFFYHSDKLLLAYFLDARQLGYYALAFTLSAHSLFFQCPFHQRLPRIRPGNRHSQTKTAHQYGLCGGCNRLSARMQPVYCGNLIFRRLCSGPPRFYDSHSGLCGKRSVRSLHHVF